MRIMEQTVSDSPLSTMMARESASLWVPDGDPSLRLGSRMTGRLLGWRRGRRVREPREGLPGSATRPRGAGCGPPRRPRTNRRPPWAGRPPACPASAWPQHDAPGGDGPGPGRRIPGDRRHRRGLDDFLPKCGWPPRTAPARYSAAPRILSRSLPSRSVTAWSFRAASARRTGAPGSATASGVSTQDHTTLPNERLVAKRRTRSRWRIA